MGLLLVLHQQGVGHVHDELQHLQQGVFPAAGDADFDGDLRLINFLVQFALFFILLLVYLAKGEVSPHWGMLLLCVPLVLQVGLLGLGCGIIVSSLTTRYRDLMVVVTFGVQLWMYGSPVVYPLSMITHPVLRAVMVINPMTAPMESFRYIFFGTGQVTGVMWASSLIWTVALLVLGLSLFSKVEKTFVDTV